MFPPTLQNIYFRPLWHDIAQANSKEPNQPNPRILLPRAFSVCPYDDDDEDGDGIDDKTAST